MEEVAGVLVLQILGGVVALAVGIYLGMPGRFDQSLDEIEERLGEQSTDHKRARRHFTFINALARDTRERGSERRRREAGQRKPFQL